MPSIDTDREAD